MQKPYISIIIPVYNRAELIASTLDSIKNQTFVDWECIIVDDSSLDNSVKIVESYIKGDNRFKFYKRPSYVTKGAASCRNYGLRKSEGKYIKWVDSDDLIDSKCLELQLRDIELHHSDVSFCKSRIFHVSHTGELIYGHLWSELNLKGILIEDYIFGKTRFCNNSGLWKRNLLPDKPYNELLRNSQEYLMILSMLCKKLDVSIVEKELVFIRSHDQRMHASRSYDDYAINQCISRFLALEVLKANKKSSRSIQNYLSKSILFYSLQSLKRRHLIAFFKCFRIFLKSITF